MKIQNIEELKEYFRNSKKLDTDRIYIDTELRRDWMLLNGPLYIRSMVYDIFFRDMGGNVWQARVIRAHDSV